MAVVCLSPNGVDTYALQRPPESLWVATMEGIFQLRRSGAQWHAGQRFLPQCHISSLMSNAAGTIVAGSHDKGLFVSHDRGAQWDDVSSQLRTANVFTLAIAVGKGQETIYAGCEPALLYRSKDGGSTWSELTALRDFPTRDKWNFPAPPHIAHVKHVASDPRDCDVLYISIEQGALLKSLDAGASFQELHFQDAGYTLNKDAHRVVFTPSNPDDIYLDGGDGIARSQDAGATWRRIATPEMRVGYPDQLFISPDDENILFVVGGGVPPNVWRQTGDARSTIARSDDRGVTWTQVAGGLPDRLRGNIEAATLMRWPGGFGFIAGTTDGEVFCSEDKGVNWTLITDNLPPVSKCIHHRNLSIGRTAAAKAG